jgi:hypothetical protein
LVVQQCSLTCWAFRWSCSLLGQRTMRRYHYKVWTPCVMCAWPCKDFQNRGSLYLAKFMSDIP